MTFTYLEYLKMNISLNNISHKRSKHAKKEYRVLSQYKEAINMKMLLKAL